MKNKLFKQKEQVEAMETLQLHYKKLRRGEKSILRICPLCKVLVLNTSVIQCNKCVWYAETGKQCTRAVSRLYKSVASVVFLRDGKGITKEEKSLIKRWQNRRIRELGMWIKKYKQ